MDLENIFKKIEDQSKEEIEELEKEYQSKIDKVEEKTEEKIQETKKEFNEELEEKRREIIEEKRREKRFDLKMDKLKKKKKILEKYLEIAKNKVKELSREERKRILKNEIKRLENLLEGKEIKVYSPKNRMKEVKEILSNCNVKGEIVEKKPDQDKEGFIIENDNFILNLSLSKIFDEYAKEKKDKLANILFEKE